MRQANGTKTTMEVAKRCLLHPENLKLSKRSTPTEKATLLMKKNRFHESSNEDIDSDLMSKDEERIFNNVQAYLVK